MITKKGFLERVMEVLEIPEPEVGMRLPAHMEDIEKVVVFDDMSGEYYELTDMHVYKSDMPHGRSQLVLVFDTNHEETSLEESDEMEEEAVPGGE